MIYFDNAATSRQKPDEVFAAYNYYVREIGTSPGRGSYSLAIAASRMLYQARKNVAEFFGTNDPSNVVFTKNSTEAINLFFKGFLQKGDHVLISPYEHNAVLRPLHFLKQENIIDYTVLPEEVFYSESVDICKFVKKNTKMIVITLASNLTGQYVFNPKIAKKAHEYGMYVFVDASQGGGKKLLHLKRDGIDAIAFTGHKDLLALPGVGGLVTATEMKIVPLIQGGTGIHGESFINPDAYPDSYEAGTLNMPAIWSLKCAIDHLNQHGDEMIKKEEALMVRLIEGLKSIDKIILYNSERKRVPTICFNISGVQSSDVVRILDLNGICVRGGIHCAILAHKTIGTVETGAVRVSINAFNNEEEIDQFIGIIGAI